MTLASLPTAGSAVGSLVTDPFADAMREGAGWVMGATLSWWVNVPSIDLETSPAFAIRGYVLWLAGAVATAGLMWQAIQMVLSRRADPLLTAGRGLFALVLWAGIGIAAPAAALRAGDAFSVWVLGQASGGRAAERLLAIASLQGVDSSGAVIVLGLLLMLAGLVQAVVMIFREGAVVVLAGVVVLAASGSMTGATKGWLPKVLGWMTALVAYKPIAALVYATAVVLIGDGQDPRTVLVGFTMMLLAIVALPALMRFFSWTTTGITAGGGGTAMLGASVSAASTAAALYGMRSGATGQADRLSRDLGSASPPGPLPSPTAGPRPGGPAPAGAAATSPQASSAAAAGAAPGASSASAAAGAPAAAAAGTTSATTTAAAGTAAAGAVPVGAALAVVAGGAALVRDAHRAAQGVAEDVTGEVNR
ncbi:hypothetical protein [Quadrisphaera sp. INWT6]|uniref:hypothetical protein n=1 Tax=Quadrisphaera sp. INWT6 TaxID=2596917 RepID=UPI0018927275|nr:hypothetical protein [Quadrisphaera sp. INWT6]